MDRLNEILYELGISKVKLAKFLGVSRQMVYNYLELDDINKWPKDKKVLLFNLLGIKSSDEIDNIKVTTDYILAVESRLNAMLDTNDTNELANDHSIYSGLGKKQKELFSDIIRLIKEKLSDESDEKGFNTLKYLYHLLQTIDDSNEIKYFLAYVAKAAGFVKPLEFVFNEEEQFVFESIMFSAMTLYSNRESASRSRLVESHRRFVAHIEHKMEEKMSRTLELNAIKVRALKELGYTEINEKNAAEVLEKIVEIESRKVSN